MINNGTLHYDHDRDGTHTQLAGCEAKMRNVDHDSYIAIRYENDILSGKQKITGLKEISETTWYLTYVH